MKLCFLKAIFCVQAAESEGGSGGSQKSSEEDSGEDESSDSSESKEKDEEDEENKEEEEEEEESEPLTLEWPTTPRKQATYLFLLPIVFPLWLTLPDVRNPVSKGQSSSASSSLKHLKTFVKAGS